MYKSREHFDYGNVHISIHPKTGGILEMYHTKNYDNLVKNSVRKVGQPFQIIYKAVDGEQKKLRPLTRSAVLRDESKSVVITTRNLPDGLLVKVSYSWLSDGKDDYPCDLYYTVKLTENGFDFNINVKNLLDETVEEVAFPILPAIFLGNSQEDDVLVYPKWAGMKYENPAELFREPEQIMTWDWQEYDAAYRIKGFGSHYRLNERGLKGVSGRYVGENCMSWMDLYDKDGGIYFACHDESLKPCTMDAGTDGVGVMMNYAFDVRLGKGDSYVSPKCVFRFHDGDWHDGAKIYREFRLPLIKRRADIMPKWAENVPGLFAHYDFKYQSGGIVHRYEDIPRIAAEAKENGMNHILLSGWHEGGFDCGFPQYKFDPDLGTEEELIEGVRKAHELGVKVTVYVNMRLHNVKYNTENIKYKAICREDGSIKYSWFGNRDITFADMCPASEQWQTEMKEHSRVITEKYGIDGIYFDVLSARSDLCFSPYHNHDFDDYAKGQLELLSDVRDRFAATRGDGMMLMGEHVSDVLGGVLTCQLNQSFLSYIEGAYPTIFRYTFPEFGIIDMLYPSKNLAMRCVQIAQLWQEFMGSLFTNGSYFWVYDLEEDNTFKRDEEGRAVLSQLIALKKVMLSAPQYLFADNDGITVRGENAYVTRFIDKNDTGKSMLAFYRKFDDEIEVECDFAVKAAKAVFADGEEKDLEVIGGNRLVMPSAKACLIYLS